MRSDLHNNLKLVTALAPIAATTDNTAYTTGIIDLAGFDSVELALQSGVLADADVTVTLLLQEGDASNLSDASTVASTDLLGTIAGAQLNFANDNQVAKIGYKGQKRYLRATITPANNTGSFLLSGLWILGDPRTSPQSTQIV